MLIHTRASPYRLSYFTSEELHARQRSRIRTCRRATTIYDTKQARSIFRVATMSLSFRLPIAAFLHRLCWLATNWRFTGIAIITCFAAQRYCRCSQLVLA